jgi:hypothetical protein
MKTLKEQTAEKKYQAHYSKMGTLSGLLLLITLIIGASSFHAAAQKVQVNVNIELPGWAPYYENASQVRYYYLPDIECYYDVRNREFIYLEDGRWIFSRGLPPVYHWFNLNNCFVVALDARVVMPWRHFHYYVAHYPRYYYRTVYRDRYRDHDHPIRGFDENERHEVYNHRYDRENSPVYKKNDTRDGGYNRNENRNGYPDRSISPAQSSEPVNYYGKKVGKPVKVQKNMRGYEEKGNKHENNGNDGKSQRKK